MTYPARPRQSARIVTTNAEESAEAEVADRATVKAKGRIICNVNQERRKMNLIEQILDKNNVRTALEKVISNKGAAGIDGMKTEDLRGYSERQPSDAHHNQMDRA